MHGRAHRLDGFQIETARLATVIEDHAQQLIYFARDFLADRFGRLFSWADSGGSSTGRNRQISSLTSSNWPPSSRNRWYSATSRCAGLVTMTVEISAPATCSRDRASLHIT
jgi:hypothetical protein